jgi:hypothetical protein
MDFTLEVRTAMEKEICTHLDKYSRRFMDAQDAYQECLAAMDEVLEAGPDRDSTRKIQRSLDQWERLTRDLRANFARLTDKGEVLLPREGQNATPVCAHCGAEVPRLEFPEFRFTEEGTLLFRGEPLLAEKEEVVAV